MNDIPFVLTTIKLLENNGIDTILFGGWAEEIMEVIKPREHKDIDLIYIGNDFSLVDSFIDSCTEFQIIERKRFTHKRAFFFKGVMIEIILIKPDDNNFVTNFWDLYSLTWPLILFHSQVFSNGQIVKVASPQIIEFYRSMQTTIAIFRNKAIPRDIAA